MIGMYDEPVAVPILDVLDSGMMSQYISAAKEQYNQAMQEQKEFSKEFGDLYSPSYSLNKLYYDKTKGRVNDALNYLYKNGIDPLRSAEGRAYIAKVIRETPYADIAKWKSDADNMKTYQKAAAAMIADGKLTQDQLDWQMQKQGLSYDKFDPYNQNWNQLAPTKMDTLEDLTKIPYSVLKPSNLTKQQVESMGYKYDHLNDYVGITDQMIKDTAGQSIPSVMSTASGQYYYDKAKQQLQQAGVTNPTDEQVKSQLQNTVAQLWEGKRTLSWDPNKYKMLDYQNRLEDQLDAKKSARDLANQKALIDYKYSDDVRRINNNVGGGSSDSNYKTIFDAAREHPYTPITTSIDDLRANGVTLADPDAKWNEYNQSQSSGDGTNKQTQSTKQQVITVNDGKYVARSGAFDRLNRGVSDHVNYGLYKKPRGKITATVTSGPTYNKKLNKYYIKANVISVNNNRSAGMVGESIWVEVKPGYIGKAPNKAN